MRERQRQELDIYSLSPNELLRYCERTGEKISRDEQVPLGLIVVDASAVIDENHARDLGELMMGEWKQTQTVLLRCRVGGATCDDVVFDVLDGFHRIEGMKLVNPGWNENGYKIKATVYYGCNDEEMLEQRIIAANSVKSVRFARLSTWMKASWKLTPWHARLTVAQAFGLANNDSSGKLLGLSEEEAEQIKAWATSKARKWLSPLGTIYQNLRTVEMAAPDLVLRARAGSFGKGQLALTPVQLEIIAENLPFKYDAQRKIAKFATRNGLSTQEIRILAERLSGENPLNEETVEKVLQSRNWIIRAPSTPEKKSQRIEVLSALGQVRAKILRYQNLKPETKKAILGKVDEIAAVVKKS